VINVYCLTNREKYITIRAYDDAIAVFCGWNRKAALHRQFGIRTQDGPKVNAKEW